MEIARDFYLDYIFKNLTSLFQNFWVKFSDRMFGFDCKFFTVNCGPYHGVSSVDFGDSLVGLVKVLILKNWWQGYGYVLTTTLHFLFAYFFSSISCRSSISVCKAIIFIESTPSCVMKNIPVQFSISKTICQLLVTLANVSLTTSLGIHLIFSL